MLVLGQFKLLLWFVKNVTSITVVVVVVEVGVGHGSVGVGLW